MKNIWVLFSILCLSISCCDVKASLKKNRLNAQLLHVVYSNDLEKIELLLEVGADVHAVDDKGETVLMKAVESGCIDVVRFLLKKKASVHAVNALKETALMYAIDDDPIFKYIVALLLKKSANVNAVDDKGQTALMRAASCADPYIAALLLENGADVHVANHKGETALMKAAEYGNKDIVALLLKHGARVDAVNKWNQTVLMYAIDHDPKYRQIVTLLLKHGADVNAVDDEGETALMYAACPKYEPVIALLLKKGASIDSINQQGQTMLMRAAESGVEKFVAFLLKKGTDVHAVDNQNKTALMYAVRSKSVDVVKLLLKHEADTRILDCDGNTALSLSRDLCDTNSQMVNLLNDFAAFNFIKNDQKFAKEPELEDYLHEKKFVQAIENSQENESDKAKRLKAFQKDHVVYWYNKVQKAYKEFVFQNNTAPLCTLLTQEVYERNTLVPIVLSFFKSQKAFSAIQEKLKIDATSEQWHRLDEIIDLQRAIAAKTIQHAFKQQKQQLYKK